MAPSPLLRGQAAVRSADPERRGPGKAQLGATLSTMLLAPVHTLFWGSESPSDTVQGFCQDLLEEGRGGSGCEDECLVRAGVWGR